jgi:aldehyde dehydrogenase (NAD+)
MDSKKNITLLLNKLGINESQKGCSNGEEWFGSGDIIDSYSPVNGSLLGKVQSGNKNDYDKLINEAEIAFKSFRKIPAPERGNLVRQLGNKIRENKAELSELVSWEMGKSLQEGMGRKSNEC